MMERVVAGTAGPAEPDWEFVCAAWSKAALRFFWRRAGAEGVTWAMVGAAALALKGISAGSTLWFAIARRTFA